MRGAGGSLLGCGLSTTRSLLRRKTIFTVMDSKNIPVRSVCPGKSYNVKVCAAHLISWFVCARVLSRLVRPQVTYTDNTRRHAMMTTAVGTFRAGELAW